MIAERLKHYDEEHIRTKSFFLHIVESRVLPQKEAKTAHGIIHFVIFMHVEARDFSSDFTTEDKGDGSIDIGGLYGFAVRSSWNQALWMSPRAADFSVWFSNSRHLLKAWPSFKYVYSTTVRRISTWKIYPWSYSNKYLSLESLHELCKMLPVISTLPTKARRPDLHFSGTKDLSTFQYKGTWRARRQLCTTNGEKLQSISHCSFNNAWLEWDERIKRDESREASRLLPRFLHQSHHSPRLTLGTCTLPF